MSIFYQRYLSALSKNKNPPPENEERKNRIYKVPDRINHLSKLMDDDGSQNVSNDATTLKDKTAGLKLNQHHNHNSHGRRVQIYSNIRSTAARFPVEKEKTIIQYSKTDLSRAFLKEALSKHYLFAPLKPEEIEKVIGCMQPINATKGEVITEQGELGTLFYCLEEGEVVITVNEEVVATYGPGNCFGELALIYGTARNASVISTLTSLLWALDLVTFRYILTTTNSSKIFQYCSFFKKCPYLDTLTNEQVTNLAKSVKTITFHDNDYIVKQGDIGDAFYIIESGTVKVTQIKSNKREVQLLTLKPGDYFGEMALVLNPTRCANCIAVGKVSTFVLDKDQFQLLLSPIMNILSNRIRMRILQSVPLLARLPENKLVQLSEVMTIQTFKQGEYIIHEGEEGTTFYVILEGEVRCTRNSSSTTTSPTASASSSSSSIPGDDEEELIVLTAQEFFGERALITKEPRKANVIVNSLSVECLVLQRDHFQILLEEVENELKAEMSRREMVCLDQATLTDTTGDMSYRFEDLIIMRTLGTGTFGRVKLVQEIHTKRSFALKCMNKEDLVASHQERNIITEKELLRSCNKCLFVINLVQTFNHPNQIFVLMEFIQGGELWSYIYEKTDTVKRGGKGGFVMEAVKFYAANVILAFEYMHSRNIAYRDLKPENLLLDSNGYLKVIDFGFAKELPFTKDGEVYPMTYTLCGTPEYLAPEIILMKGYDKSVDYWALGCLIYELYFGRTPFQDESTNIIFENIVDSENTLNFPPGTDSELQSLVFQLLEVNPFFRLGNMRSGVADIKNDSFFHDLDWKEIEFRRLVAPYVPVIENSLDCKHFDEYEEEDFVPEYTGEADLFAEF